MTAKSSGAAVAGIASARPGRGGANAITAGTAVATDPTDPTDPAGATTITARTEVTVAVPREHAFRVFTERFDAWWPRSHYTGSAELAEAVIEPRAGGRWYTRSTDGSEGEWGSVLAWAPPERVVLAWQLDADFRYDPNLLTEVEVTFTALDPHRTRVVLEHRRLENYGERAAEVRGSVGNEDGGWGGLLRIFAGVAENADGVDSADPTGV